MRKWNPLIASCLGTFMLLIDVTIVTVALPDIARSTGASFATLQWVLDAYALVLGALVLGMGAVADDLGHKRVYIAGTALFAAASLACGLADSGGPLVAARAVQGIGGAAMFATTIALVHASYTGRDRAVAFGVWGAVSGASAGIGVVLGGILTQWAGWRWVFMVNIPVSVVAMALSAVAFRETTRRRVGLDVPGIAAFSATAGALILGVIRGGENGWGDPVTVGALVVAALGLVGFVAIESRAAHPMLPLQLLREPRFTASLVSAAGMNFAAFSGSVLLSIWLQEVLRLSAVATGCALLPMSAVAFVAAGVLGHRLDGAPPQRTIGLGLVVIGAGAGLLTTISAGSHWYAAAPGLAVIGVGVGVAAPALGSVALAAVPPQMSGVASGAVNTARQLGFALGVAVLGSVFAATAGSSRPATAARFADGLTAALTVAAAVGLTAGVVGIVLFARSGRAVPVDREPDTADTAA